jgi:hypothetical protein
VRVRLRAVTFLLTVLIAHAAFGSIAVTDTPRDGDFALVAKGRVAPVVVDEGDHRVVAIAAGLLVDDVERVTGKKPALAHAKPEAPAVIVGSLDKSGLIRALVDAGKLDVADLQGQWECFKFARVDESLVIVGSDRRGTAYGALELSRAIGVSPWYWWADVPPRRRDSIHLAVDDVKRVGPPSVKYRGIFVNDEDWGLQPWAAKTFEPDVHDIGPKTYARIFELLLRLKANYCWPAMHECTAAFNADPRNKQVADDYAIVMGSSHAEPMLRNNVSEWPHDQAKLWNPVTNLPAILKYWDDRVRENGRFENVYTVGMRGIHDGAMPGGGTIDEKRQRLEQIIGLQRDMLAKHVNPNPAAVPQIFCPYKEVLDIYRSGLALPDDVTIVWPDDNFGYIRQLSDERERTRGGRSGVYYHLSYNGRPHDYLWLESIPPALIWHEMTKAHEFGADRLWVVNVGDIKPLEAGMSLFLEVAWKVDRYGADVSRVFLRDFYTDQFGPAHADAITDVKREYFRLCAIRKPETFGWNTVYPNTPVRDGEFSHDPENDEAMQLVGQWRGIALRAEAIAPQLAKEQRPAYFQLVQYPAAAGAAMVEKMILAERSRLLAARGDAAANRFADRAEAAMKRIEELTRQYNEQFGGKWRHMMDDHPRKLPVFDPPLVARVDAASPSSAPATTKRASPRTVVIIDIAHPARLSGTSPRWTVIEGLGRTGAAITMSPRLLPQSISADAIIPANAPVAEYATELPERTSGGDYEIVIDALPTQPITPQHQLACGISFDDAPPQIVRFDQSSDERNRTWQQNALRNSMTARTTVTLRPGKHALRMWGIDPSVSVQGVTLAPRVQ